MLFHDPFKLPQFAVAEPSRRGKPDGIKPKLCRRAVSSNVDVAHSRQRSKKRACTDQFRRGSARSAPFLATGRNASSSRYAPPTLSGTTHLVGHATERIHLNKLPRLDSNQEKRLQRPLCYRLHYGVSTPQSYIEGAGPCKPVLRGW